MRSDRFVANIDVLAHGKAYERLAGALEANLPPSVEKLVPVIKTAFSIAAPDLVNDSDFQADRKRLGDSLIAAKLGEPPDGTPLRLLARNLRLIVLIERAAAGDAGLDAPGGIAGALDACIALPPGLLPLPAAAPPPREDGDTPGESEREQRHEDMRRNYRELSEAHAFLHALRVEHFADVESPMPSASPLHAEPRPDINESLLRELRDLHAAVGAQGRTAQDQPSALLATAPRVATGGRNLMLKRDALEEAPAGVRAGLRTAGLDLSDTPVPVAIERLAARLTELTPFVVEQTFDRSNVVMVGGQFLPANTVPDLKAAQRRRTNG